MTPADAARLTLAKRAYEAARPNAAEVQAGVRRARLALRRPKLRRSFWSKGLVLVVLAIGSLAYAKPHQFSAMVEQVLRRASSGGPAAKPGAAKSRPVLASARALPAPSPRDAEAAGQAPPAGFSSESAARDIEVESAQVEARESAQLEARGPAELEARGPAQPEARGPLASAKAAAQIAKGAAAKPRSDAVVSEWGRVGRALASGDESTALAALSELGRSQDPDTRDKADLGRAQLLLARGNREAACSLARSLIERDARGRIQRQAWALVTSCAR
jgi:hypothetical protein